MAPNEFSPVREENQEFPSQRRRTHTAGWHSAKKRRKTSFTKFRRTNLSRTRTSATQKRKLDGTDCDQYYEMNSTEGGWNKRFHVTPSQHNQKTHIYFKEFFDKPTKLPQSHVIQPEKFLDPYLSNEIKSRIPNYSKVYSKKNRSKPSLPFLISRT